jgi:peptidoglycan/LPS O-acetylase OafA/YrhL
MIYRREIDGLRAIAVLPVVFFHAGFAGFRGGFVGVDVFFVISGYLITSLILSERERGTFSLVHFYERRARRILPALIAVAAACIPCALAWLSPNELVDFGKSLIAVALFASNLFFWLESDYFDAAADLKPLLHTWSLAVEEQYYVLFPVLMGLAWPLGRRRILAVLTGVALFSLALAHWGAYRWPDANFYLLPTRAWELAIGATLAFRAASSMLPDSARGIAWKEALSAGGLVLICAAVVLFDPETPLPSLYSLVPTVGASLVILFAVPATWAGRLLGARPLVAIGLVSYSAYLWHQPLFAFARHRSLDEPSTLVFMVLAACAFVLAGLTWKYVEQPFRQRDRIGRRSVFGLAAVASTVLVVVGAIGVAHNGFVDRYPAGDQRIVQQLASGRSYVIARFDSLRRAPFNLADPRPKVVIIGDSYAQDLVNALYEGGLADAFQLTTHDIPVRCGNLYVHRSFQHHIAPKDRASCQRRKGYRDPSLQALLRQADQVWLASSWRGWQAEMLNESIHNLERDYGARVVVIGRKHFGHISARRLLDMPLADRLSYRSAMSNAHLDTDALMRRIIDPKRFVDVSALMCGSGTTCPQFTASGGLVSHDGRHLAPDGARALGVSLRTHPLIGGAASPGS